MKRKRYTEEPIGCVLRQAEAGTAHTGMAMSSLCGLCETHLGSSRLTWKCPPHHFIRP